MVRAVLVASRYLGPNRLDAYCDTLNRKPRTPLQAREDWHIPRAPLPDGRHALLREHASAKPADVQPAINA